MGLHRILRYTDEPGGLDTPKLDFSLNQLGRLQKRGDYGKALDLCGEILERFGSSEADSIVRDVTGVRVTKGLLLARMDRSDEALTVLNGVVEKWKPQLDRVGAKRFLACALCQKGLVLARLGREEEAVKALDEVVRRFDRSEDREVLELVANASLNKAIGLSKLRRFEPALLAYDQVTRVAGRCQTPALIERAFKAYVNKSVLQANLHRFEDSLKTGADAQKLVHDHEHLQIPEYRAKTLLNQAHSLQGLDRFKESLDTCDQALGILDQQPSGTTARLEAQIQFQRAFVLENLERHEEAVRVYELLERNFIRGDDQETVELAISAVINKTQRLAANGRTDEAITGLDELERIDWPKAPVQLTVLLGKARLNKAALCIEIGDLRTATAIATEVVDTRSPSFSSIRARAHWVRAESRYKQGNVSGCESDIKAALCGGVEDDSGLHGVIRTLVVHAVRFGSDRILQLIESSPSASALSPLAAALQIDLGAAPRVAREVIEVARDIQRELKQLRLDQGRRQRT